MCPPCLGPFVTRVHSLEKVEKQKRETREFAKGVSESKRDLSGAAFANPATGESDEEEGSPKAASTVSFESDVK